jgi:cation-transporting P-type ATPase E
MSVAASAAPGAWADTDPRTGLDEQEARRRREAMGERPPPVASRSTASIVRANTLTPFNLILVVFGGLTLLLGDLRDALFLVILVANSGIGIVQELRAKRALDRLARLVAPVATVVRGGERRRLTVDDVVPGDLLAVGPGDQFVADGRIVVAEGLALDEAALTGESLPVVREPGDDVRAGAYVAEGTARYVAIAVGAQSYAQRIVGTAHEQRDLRSPLQRAIDRLLYLTVAAMIPLGIAFAVALVRRDTPTRDAITSATAGVVTLVPEGLILLVSLAYALSAMRMARRGALAQRLSAIEALSSVDVVCMDKTGTITEEALRLIGTVPAPGVQPAALEEALARYAAASPEAEDTLIAALREAPAAEAETPSEIVPFSSRRRWSALRLDGEGLVLGDPGLVAGAALAGRAREEAGRGRRVVALARTRGPIGASAPDAPPPAGLEPLGLVILAERLRESARETVAFLTEQGVRLVVVSGDARETVAAIARDAGIPVGPEALEGTALVTDQAALGKEVLAAGAIGRTPPEAKRRVVEALTAAGASVAMIGDGVNDVPALKAAEVAVVPGSGADIARSVADLVLVKGGFASVPGVIGEGRKLLRNLQRVAKLFVSKSVLAAFLIITVGLSPTNYPFLPRHLTLISFLTIGIPAFVLALAPSSGPWRTDGFMRELFRFAVPAGVAAGLGVVASFLLSLNVLETSLEDARSAAVLALVLIGLYLVVVLEGSSPARTRWVGALALVLLGLYLAVLASAGLRDFFAVESPDAGSVFSALVGAGLAVIGLSATDARFVPQWGGLLPRSGDVPPTNGDRSA